MQKRSYYLDTCIWLNIFKREGDLSKGTPYWKIALDFVKSIENSGGEIIVSPIILREIYSKLGEKYSLVKDYFDKNSFISLIEVFNEDYILARKFESASNFTISFYDCIHIAMAKRLNIDLVTRDNSLIAFAKSFISVKKPEELL